MSYGISGIMCVLMVIGLLRGFRPNGTTLPSFVALTTLESLAFCMFCLSASLGIKSYGNDGQIIFAMFVTAPFFLGFCLVTSALAFVIVKVTPRLSGVIVSDADKRLKTRVVSIAVLCTGLVLACAVFIDS